MLTNEQLRAAKVVWDARPLRHEQIDAIAALTTFETVEDRSEWYSRCGYAAAYGATSLGITAEARFPGRSPKLGNIEAREGCDRCSCGCKYWENDRCIDCGEHVRHAVVS